MLFAIILTFIVLISGSNIQIQNMIPPTICNFTILSNNPVGDRVLLFYVSKGSYLPSKAKNFYSKMTCCFAKKHNYFIHSYNSLDNLLPKDSRYYVDAPHLNEIPHYWRIPASKVLLNRTENQVDFLVYMDVDIAMNYAHNVSIQALVNAIEVSLGQMKCDIILQDMSDNINSGFIIMRNSPITHR